MKQNGQGNGQQFSRAFDAAIEDLRAFPLSRAQVAPGIRCWKVKRFPYAIIYEVGDEHILVIAVMHLSRRPGDWISRLEP
jgi:hypothetical protein